ncbi:hypothetical protein GCM10009753_00750 [Streptantibioticus ferralitis]
MIRCTPHVGVIGQSGDLTGSQLPHSQADTPGHVGSHHPTPRPILADELTPPPGRLVHRTHGRPPEVVNNRQQLSILQGIPFGVSG